MSILLIDTRIFSAVACKMESSHFSKTVDINYFYCCRNLTNDEMKQLLSIWHLMNVESYSLRYNEKIQVDPIKFSITTPVSTYQLLKWLQCIAYNIEIENIKSVRDLTQDELNALDFLKRLIADASAAIINSLPAYEKANWEIF